MTTDLSALSRRISTMAAQGETGYRAIPAPEKRYVPFPLNDMQQAYWIGRSNEIAGGGTAIQYYIGFSMPKFDAQRFDNALNKLVARHDMLRVVVLADGTQQVLENPPSMTVQVEDISSMDDSVRNDRLDAIVEEVWSGVSDLTQWPQHEFRYTVTEADGKGILHCKLDMWCFDGRSTQIFFEELAALYSNPQTELRPLELRFCDYMRAMREEEKSPTFARDLAYWKNRIKSMPPPPALPMGTKGRSQPQEASGTFTTREVQIPSDKTAEILQACAEQGVSLTAFMASAYSDVLSFWSGQRDLTLNFPRFNRNLDWHPDVNDIIGEFATFSLLETRHAPQSNFLERTRQLQERMWEDLEHGSVSGLRVLRERIIETGQPEMQAMPIVFTAMPDRRGTQDALEKAFAVFGEIRACRGATPQVWLDCQYFVLNNTLHVSWDSQDQVFPEGMIEDMFSEYIGALNRLANTEEWSQTNPVQIPKHQFEGRQSQNNISMELGPKSVFHQFSEMAKSYPEHTALVSNSQSISYSKLYEMVLRLAGAIAPYTKELPPKSQDSPCVAIILERGWKQHAAAMGIVAAGLAYVPIDPALPSKRKEAILEQAAPCLILEDTTEIIAAKNGYGPTISFDQLLETIKDSPLPALEALVLGPKWDAPAYIIFTSGSTGIPKGVTVGHEALLNLVKYSNELFSLHKNDTVFGITALHHDLSVYDLFGTLCAGATLVLPSLQEFTNPEVWPKLVQRHGVTFWNSVPMYMEQLLKNSGDEKLPLKTVVLGGDWVNPAIHKRLRRTAPQASLYTIGGPTETTVWNIINKVEDVPQGWESLPYGRPIKNASYYILDDSLADVPDWTPGEMYCGGLPLCQKASLNPEENKRAFAIHPITKERIYRTGDLGRYRDGGMIEILGRKDFQLNINGYRLDPSEVEQIINRNKDVLRTVVTSTDDNERKGNVLTAFVKIRTQDRQTKLERELRQMLNEQLPVSMRPRRWIFLDEFPLTPNGKLDRKGLSALIDKNTVADEMQQRPPANPVETFLFQIWQEILPGSVSGVRTSFFESGGDSLKAVQVFARLENRLGIRLSLAQMFITPTIEGIAEEIYRQIENTMDTQESAT